MSFACLRAANQVAALAPSPTRIRADRSATRRCLRMDTERSGKRVARSLRLDRAAVLAGDRVADSAHGTDRAFAELPAQVVDMHFDRIARHFLAPAVEPLLELRARQRRPRALEQRLQQ